MTPSLTIELITITSFIMQAIIATFLGFTAVTNR